MSDPTFGELDALVRRKMREERLTGCAVALVRGAEIVFARGYGLADLASRAPFTPATVFSVQSVTKSFVATAVMQLRDRGLIDLDAPVNGYLAPVQVENEWETSAPVTARRLLTHTAGLPVDMGGTTPPSDSDPEALAQFVSAVARTARPPGGEIVYANFGYDVLGYLVQRLSRRPFSDYLREHVLAPLGMDASYVGRPPGGVTPATPYFLSAIDAEHYSLLHDYDFSPFPRPGGVLLSTVEDLARFLVAHLNGGEYGARRILESETAAEMHRLHAAARPSAGGVGLGFRVDTFRGRPMICHGGDGAGATTCIAAIPSRHVGVALMINTGRAHTARAAIVEAALALLAGDTPDSAHDSAQDERDGDAFAELYGSYRSNFWGHEATVTEQDGALRLTVDNLPAPGDDGAPSTLRRIGAGRFAARGGFFHGAELTFGVGPAGATSFAGGLYPWRFDRTGPAAEQSGTPDAEAPLAARWTGTIASPFGPVPITLDLRDASRARVTAIGARDAPLLECFAGDGRVTGSFDTSLPGLGEFRIFLRLHAAGGRLLGKAYARGAFGETPMRTELTRG